MPTVEENESEFERMGLARVKMLIGTSGLAQHMMHDAVQWVARGEETERQRQLAFETEQRQRDAEQLQIALSTLKATRSTLKAAWIAAGVSILAIVLTCLFWFFPHK